MNKQVSSSDIMYTILRAKQFKNGIVSYDRLMEYSSLEDAANYMKTHSLIKVDEKHFDDYKLVQWIV